MRENLRQRLIGNRGNTSQILAECMEQLTDGGRMAMGRTNSLKRNIQRQKQATRPKEPASLQELRIENEWTTTGGEEERPSLFTTAVLTQETESPYLLPRMVFVI